MAWRGEQRASRGGLGAAELRARRVEAVRQLREANPAVGSSLEWGSRGGKWRRGVERSRGASRGGKLVQEMLERPGGRPEVVRAAGGRGKPAAAAAQRLR